MFPLLKRLLVGRPLATAEQEHQRLPKRVALATFASDPISSTAYATEEILFVTAVGASSLVLGLSKLVPMSIAVAILLAVVVTSYRRTIYAYPQGGGAYVVSRENLGTLPSLVAGGSILVDYTLTVAVSVSAGVAAIISIPAFRGLVDDRVTLALVLVGVLTFANLRGLKESATMFAFPTYAYVLSLGVMIAYGLFRSYTGDVGTVPFDEEQFVGTQETGGALGLFLILKGFSSGAVALTGIEAVAVGVPAFRRPVSRNAATTLGVMAVILGSLFFGLALLSDRLHPFPSHDETVLSQLGRVVFGGGPAYVVLQFATAAILVLAANTAYAAFPSLTSMMARDGFLPRQLANRGDRLVFSNGILFLALAAGALIVAFGGLTNALIPLYAIGVFTSFTLSQLGMVRYQRENRQPVGAAVSAFGALITGGVLVVIAVTKFTAGAWVPLVLLPALISVFLAIARHYRRVGEELRIEPDQARPQPLTHTVVVLVGAVNKPALKALRYAQSLRPNHLAALYVSFEDQDREEIQRQWEAFRIDVPLEIVHSPYRELVQAVEAFLDELDQRWSNDTITVIIPEFVVDHWFENALHNQSSLALKWALLNRPGTVVTSVPYHVGKGAVAGPP